MRGTNERAALAAARHGDYESVLNLVAADDDRQGTGLAASAWSLAARVAIDLARRCPPSLPVRSAIAQLQAGITAASPADGRAHAARLLVRRAALEFDAEGLRAAAELHAESGEIGDGESEAVGIEMWSAFAAGDWRRVARCAEALRRLATDVTAELRLEAAALLARARQEDGDLSAALDMARAASSESRAASFPQAEYLANLVLARMRRYHGTAYLATRILGALAPIVPRAWAGWLRWESTMASPGGGREPPRSRFDSERAADDLGRAFERARADDRDGFIGSMVQLEGWATRWPPLAADVRSLRGASLPEDERDVTDALRQWRCGERHGLAPGIGSPHAGDDQVGGGWVLVDAGSAGRRVTGVSVGIHRDATTTFLDAGHAGRGRMEKLLAVLALAGPPGVAEPDLFARVYGFRYAPEVHGGTFGGVLLHRARERVGTMARLERSAGTVRLEVPTGRLLCPDPRCTTVDHDRVLRHLSEHGVVTARAIARALSIPLRSVQATLKDLVEHEICDRERRGREWTYRVEDTTFREPTKVPLPPE